MRLWSLFAASNLFPERHPSTLPNTGRDARVTTQLTTQKQSAELRLNAHPARMLQSILFRAPQAPN